MDGTDREAFEVEKVVPKVEGKITSLASHANHVYVGTNKGVIHMYRWQETRDGRVESRLIETTPLVARKSVDQMEAVSDLGHLVALCDGLITVHHLLSLEKIHNAIAVKGVSMFCLNQKGPPLYRLCCVRRKTLLVYENSLKRYTFLKELGLPDVPVSMAWYEHNLYIGFKREYNLLDDESGDVDDIHVGIDSRTKPVIKFMPNRELLLAGQEKIGVYINLDGNPAMRSCVSWSQPPAAVAYCYPYLISLLPKAPYLEVHSWRDQRLVQRVRVGKGASCLVDSLFAGDTARGRNPVFFSVPGSVMRLRPIAYERQVEYLVRNKSIDEAFDLLDNTTDDALKPMKLSRFHLDAGRVLFLDLQFEEAVTHLRLCPIDPREIIAMYPQLQAPGFSYKPRYFNAGLLNAIIEGRKAPGDGATAAADAPDGSEGIPALRLPDRTLTGGGGSSAGAGGAGAGAGGSWSRGRSRTDTIGSAKSVVPDFLLVVRGVLSRKSSAVEGVAVDRVVNESLRYVVQFLKDRRKKYKALQVKGADLEEALDTALLKAYAFRREGVSLDKFAAGKNAVHLEAAREFLLGNKLFHVLALLYKSRDMPREALTMWMQMGSGDSRFREPGHDGLSETVSYLSQLDDHELVWIFSPWVLRKDYKAAMAIFTSNKRTMNLRPERVLEHLQSFEDLQTGELCQIYLEFLINIQQNKEPRYHTQLAREYLKTVVTLRRDLPEEEAGSTHRERPEPGTEPGKLGEVRGKLVRLLVVSDHYDVAGLLRVTEPTTLYEERVILHSKDKDHRSALRLLVYELSNFKEAEAYCVLQHATSVVEEGNDPFMVLLNIYFGDTTRQPAFTEAAMMLLKKHGKAINPAEVLKALPLHLPVADLYSYLSQVIPHTAHSVRDAQVVKSLYRYENVRVNCELIKEKRRSVLITSGTYCGVCRLRIGDSMFAVYPNDTVVHMHCAHDSLDVDPVTGEKFRARR